ncbi:glycosyltransferase [Marinobacter sp. S6332]|uniref:glycosyltransferase n=1 Tax=Marinobacter sp. S6332 TaxID=2926403 RepID=UPI001FF2EC2E|nr:glycosyltransferase [Marinobacter sp. S6332]MCK0163756.1 glycosyltransferase [Marinobacter sp. S6332]
MKNPYYIMAPDFRNTSAGVHVLYALCDKLNGMGFDAFIVGSTKNDSSLNAPVLQDNDMVAHQKNGNNPIAVYPEIISGNPLSAKVCVRYMLNREGVIRGNEINASESDLFFFYNEPFMEGMAREGYKLKVPVIDLDVFCPPKEEKRFRRLLYLNRYPRDGVDFDQLPDDIEVLSMSKPLSHEELAGKLKQAEVLYSYEYSTTCTMAMLCGCPLVVKEFESGHKYGFTENNLLIYGGLGYALSDDPASISIAKHGLAKFRQNRIEQDKEVGFQLERFVEYTQEAAENSSPPLANPLASWSEGRTLTPEQFALLKNRISGDFKICVIIVDRESSGDRLSEAVKAYRLARVAVACLSCIVLTNSSEFDEKVSAPDLVISSFDPQDLARSINDAAMSSQASWFLVSEPGTVLGTNGVMTIALELQSAPESCVAVFGDELISEGGDIHGALLRPDFNLDMLLSHPSVTTKHWFFRREAFMNMGGFDTSLKSAFQLDLILRILENNGFGAFGHVAEPVLISNQEIGNADDGETKAVILEHLRRRGYSGAEVTEGYAPATYDVNYGPTEAPSVSIVVVAKDQLAHLQTCVESILEKAGYVNYEILIFDNNSKTPEAKAWLNGLAEMGVSNIRVFHHSHTVNRSVAVNKAVSEARGEYLVLLGSDTGIIRKDWLQSLLNHAQRPEVGIVGAKILAADGNVSSAGIVAGLNGVSSSTFVGEDASALGYMSRLQVDQNCSLVTDDCMMFSQAMFAELGGFDESLDDLFCGADFCFRVGHSGRLNVWTPRTVVMKASVTSQVSATAPENSRVSPSRAESENLIYDRWLTQLANDPSYNRNFSLAGPGFEVEQRIDLSWQPQKLLGQSTVLVYPADQWGCGHYRMMQPLEAMKALGVAGGMIAREWLTVPEIAKLNPDSCVYQRQITDEAIASMKQVRRFLKKPVVYELDDYLPNLPLKSAYRKNMPKDILKSLRRSLKHVDRFVVSTHPLAEAFKGIHSDIRVVENRLPLEWWQDLNSMRRQSDKPRVGWAGGIGHTGDLELVEAVVRELAEEVDWVLFGMCPDSLKPFVKEVHEGVDIALYPPKLASMNLDLAIAPLEDNLFNRCKSNLRLLEYGACGFPVVCSDVEPYRAHGLPVTRVKNRYKDWMDAIRMHLSDLDETARQGDELKSVILRDWMLEGENLQQWLRAWTKF